MTYLVSPVLASFLPRYTFNCPEPSSGAKTTFVYPYLSSWTCCDKSLSDHVTVLGWQSDEQTLDGFGATKERGMGLFAHSLPCLSLWLCFHDTLQPQQGQGVKKEEPISPVVLDVDDSPSEGQHPQQGFLEIVDVDHPPSGGAGPAQSTTKGTRGRPGGTRRVDSSPPPYRRSPDDLRENNVFLQVIVSECTVCRARFPAAAEFGAKSRFRVVQDGRVLCPQCPTPGCSGCLRPLRNTIPPDAETLSGTSRLPPSPPNGEGAKGSPSAVQAAALQWMNDNKTSC